MRKEDVVGSLFCVITANGLCYSSVVSNTVMSISVICIRFHLFLSLSEKAKITDSFGLNGNDKVCKEVCYRIITISHFLKYVIIRFIIEIY